MIHPELWWPHPPYLDYCPHISWICLASTCLMVKITNKIPITQAIMLQYVQSHLRWLNQSQCFTMFHHLSSIQPPYFSTFKTFHSQPPQVFTIFGRSTRASAPSPSGRCRPPPGRRAAARRPLGRRRGRAWGCHSLGDFAKKDGWICFDICYTLQGLSIYIIYIYYYIHYVYSFLYSHTYIHFVICFNVFKCVLIWF